MDDLETENQFQFDEAEITVGRYSIRRISIDDYEISGPYNSEKKIVCGGDLETVLSTIFI